MRIRARGWRFRYAGRSEWAVRDLDLDIEPGERVLLAGPSGAGKSTLLTAIAGLLDPDQAGETAGSLTVGGEPPAAVRHRIGLVFQDPETQLVMARCGDDVAFGLENLGVPTDVIWPRVDAALELTGFPYGREHPTGRLSGGEKQRLVLSGVMALDPDLLLLDEPTANLDPEGAALVREAVDRALAATGAGLLVVDHRVDDWLPLVNRVIVLDQGGSLLADGEPTQIYQSYADALQAAGVWLPGSSGPVRRASKPAGPTVLFAEDLTYTYPGHTDRPPAVSDIRLELQANQALAITGPNGSGKSTLALLLAGLLPPTSGRVDVTNVPDIGSADTPAARLSRRRRPLHRLPARQLVRMIGTVFQDPEHQFLTQRVYDELALGPRVMGRSPDEVSRIVDELLQRLHLSHLADANPFTLSGGEKRRLSVATALATGPAILLLDEPTFGQDLRTWLELIELLAELRDAGHAIGFVSHDPQFVAALADRTVELKAGRLVA